MRKQILSFLLVVSLCLSFGGAIYATGDISAEKDEPVLNREFLSSSEIKVVDDVVIVTKETEKLSGRSTEIAGKKESIALIPDQQHSAIDVVEDIEAFLASRSGNETLYRENMDSTLSARAYSTLYYTRKTENSRDMILLTKVSGGVKILDSQATVSSQKLEIGCSGAIGGSQHVTKYPTTTTWSYTTPSSWKYVPDIELSYVGATNVVTLKRPNNYTWTFEQVNNALGQFN